MTRLQMCTRGHKYTAFYIPLDHRLDLRVAHPAMDNYDNSVLGHLLEAHNLNKLILRCLECLKGRAQGGV